MKRILAVLAAIALTAGCSSATPEAPEETASTTEPFAIDSDFPDPDVLLVDDTYYAYATNGPGFNIRLATSPDLESWTVAEDPLPTLPEWSLPGKTWAPDVSEFEPGEYVMYFTAAYADQAVQCIGVATASDPAGPFTPVDDEPLVCPTEDGGAIDPATFVDDDGSRYLLFKNDGNCCGYDTFLQIVELSQDGLSTTGDVTKLIKQDLPWEGNLVEAPTLVKRDGVYGLFYSANDYGNNRYATGFASSESLLGPYTKSAEPFLTTDSTEQRYLGPGGQDVVTKADGSEALMFHSWDDLYIYRGVNVVPLTWDNGVPSVTLP